MVAPAQFASDAPTILIRSVVELHVPELRVIVTVVVPDDRFGTVVGANVVEKTAMAVPAVKADVYRLTWELAACVPEIFAPVAWSASHITHAAVDAETPSENVTESDVARPPPSDAANRQFPFAPSRLRVTVVVPLDTPPTRFTLRGWYTSLWTPAALVARALSLACVTVIEPDNVVATAMAVWVSVLYELTDAMDTVTVICPPVACPAAHLTYMSVVEATPFAIVWVFVVAYVPPSVWQNVHVPSVFDILMLTVVTPTDAVARVILSCVAVLIKMPGSLVGSAASSCLVTVMVPVRVVATAMAGVVRVSYASEPAVLVATSCDPVASAVAHWT
jgi:hypothetical protein